MPYRASQGIMYRSIALSFRRNVRSRMATLHQQSVNEPSLVESAVQVK
jgi:hypothetical protein